MHVLGLRTGQVIDLADVRVRIGEQRGDHTCNVFRCDLGSGLSVSRRPGCCDSFQSLVRVRISFERGIDLDKIEFGG
jgi:hypothetical protein